MVLATGTTLESPNTRRTVNRGCMNVTEWVTIKVPAETRDKARDDPRTYEEILQAGLQSEPPEDFGLVRRKSKTEAQCDGVDVDEQAIANAVTSDLLASLPSKVAEEMEGRMR